MDLAKTFDLRFIVIHDRFDSNKFQVKKITKFLLMLWMFYIYLV